ncbi:MAG: hypothetical protein HQM08_09915 [Candidatus Riflebacteria bacterium]|nr:hypothetical protein [Candidatus Riflebacteria bacterium]
MDQQELPGSPLEGNEILKEKLQKIGKKLDELERTQKWANNSTLLGVFIIVATMLTFIFQLLMPIYELKDKTQPLLREMEKNASGRFFPILRAQLLKLLSMTIPAYRDAFVGELKVRLPEIEKSVSNELENLVKGTESEISDLVESRLNQIIKKHESLLRTEFPEIENDPKISGAVDQVLASAIHRVLGEYLLENTEKFGELLKTIDEIRVPQKIKSMKDDTLQEYLINNLTAYFNEKTGSKVNNFNNLFEQFQNFLSTTMDILEKESIHIGHFEEKKQQPVKVNQFEGGKK